MELLFDIQPYGMEDAAKLAATPNDPHVHEWEELLVGIEGDVDHFIDFKSSHFRAPYISFITKGKIHRAKPMEKDGRLTIWLIRFRSEFIPETTFQLYSWYHDHATLELPEGTCFERLNSVCDLMYGLMQMPTPDYPVIRHLLSALFTMIESFRKEMVPEQINTKTQNLTFKTFLQLLEENFRRPEGVEFYADKLFMTSRNLNLICQNILQQSVSEIIETRKLIEAKNLLLSTDKSVSEIGFDLGYNEKAYFTTVFKRRSGQTPTEFREEMRKLIS
ncbi:MAG: AraC family transcriptional regulator [Marinilabiliales bacterium]|nr:AraC family transcriptional regulator [Marinilabiliales bacterium]